MLLSRYEEFWWYMVMQVRMYGFIVFDCIFVGLPIEEWGVPITYATGKFPGAAND